MRKSPSFPCSASSPPIPSYSYQNRFSPATFCASMLRRLLFCSNSLPAAPPPSNYDDPGLNFHATSAPCLVARLMGLDSLPPPPVESPRSLILSSRPSSSITKSWSMSSLELRRLTTESTQGSLDTSLSFREEPNYVELEDDHFFILSFEKKKFRSKRRGRGGDRSRSKLGYGKLKQISNEEEEQGWKNIPKQSKGGKKIEESESDCEHWSPVSVLDDVDELATTSSDLSTPVNETEESELIIDKVQEDLRTHNPNLSKNFNFKLLLTSPRINLITASLDHTSQKPNSKWCKKRKIKMWNEEIRRISEEEMGKSRWDYYYYYGEASTKLQEVEVIGDYIIGILLRELLEEDQMNNSQQLLTNYTLMMMI